MFTRPADRPGLFLLPEPVSIIKLFFLIVGLQRHLGDFPSGGGREAGGGSALLNPSLTCAWDARPAQRRPVRPAGGRQVLSQSQPGREAPGTRVHASRAPGRSGRRLHLRRRFRSGDGGAPLCRRLPVRAPGPRRYFDSGWGRGREVWRPGRVKVLGGTEVRRLCTSASPGTNPSTFAEGGAAARGCGPPDGWTGQRRQATPLSA